MGEVTHLERSTIIAAQSGSIRYTIGALLKASVVENEGKISYFLTPVKFKGRVRKRLSEF